MAAEAKRQASIWTTMAICEANHVDDETQAGGRRKILIEEFMEPMGLTQGALAEAMGVQRKHINELCNDRRNTSEPQSYRKRRFTGSISQSVRRLDPHQDRVAIEDRAFALVDIR